MVALNQLQLHFSALLIDARKKNQATAISLVADNPVAPKGILSKPSFRRTRSTGKLPLRNRPKPTKKTPVRSSSAPCSILKRNGNVNESRWESEVTSSCGCSSRLSRSRAVKQIKSSPKAASKSPPRYPRRTSDEDDASTTGKDVVSALPPKLPTRKRGEAFTEWKAFPPQIPCRRLSQQH